MAHDGEADAAFGPEQGPVQRTRPPGARPGSVLWGLAQSLALFLAGGLLVRGVTGLSGVSEWYVPVLGGALVTSVALGFWHRSRGRTRTAAGAFAGALAWPASGCTLGFAAVVVYLSTHEFTG